MSRSLTQVMGVLEAVRRLEEGARGAATGQLRSYMSQHHGVSAPECKRLLKRAVTEGYLLRKSNKFYFVPSNNVALPALAVMRRRRIKKGGKRSRRGVRYAVLAGGKGGRSPKVRICTRRSIDLVSLPRSRISGRRRRIRSHETQGSAPSNPSEQTNNTAAPPSAPEDSKNIGYIS